MQSLNLRLTRINTRRAVHICTQGHWRQSLTGSLIRYYMTQTCPGQPQKRTVISPRGRRIHAQSASTMPQGTRASSSRPSTANKTRTLSEPRPSSSILLLSPTNQVLLLRRVKTSTSFASAHVFPGGNLSDFHDGTIPPPGDAKRHVDSLAYRLGAIRETFEESGILLAREGSKDGPLLNLPTSERDEARKAIYRNDISFTKWLEGVGGIADTENLLPFTRWITPAGQSRKRFTTQMYVYMLPLETSSDPVLSAAQHEALIPTPDGGAEVTAAHFDEVSTWLEKQGQGRGEVILFPPQYFLLQLLSQFLKGVPGAASLGPADAIEHYSVQREKLRSFLHTVPTSTHPEAVKHPTSQIPWADKVISPALIGMRHSDGRSILALDKPGPELSKSDRGGDWERVVLVKFEKSGPKNVEVRDREEVLAEEREAKKAKEEAPSKL